TGAYRHVNRAGEAYYLQSKPDTRGKTRYSFARKITGTPCPAIPEGYEAREDPRSAQVTLRKRQPSQILDEELALLTDAVRRACPGLYFIIDREARSLVIYTADIELDSQLASLRAILSISDSAADTWRREIAERARYAAMMKFTPATTRPRRFYPYRWHFSGSIDDWISIGGGPAPLAELTRKFVPHLNQESFFDLM
ncbi:MAG TPA: hypothetical protein PKB10_13695, partial [Tepidisphaeraceae bacterium]|nr:hypothetical protein [Tepidisphaeraceae bacterium]